MNAAMLETTLQSPAYESQLDTRSVQSDEWLITEPEMGEPTGSEPVIGSGDKWLGDPHRVSTRPVAVPKVVQPIKLDVPSAKPPEKRIKLLQQWECVVAGVSNDCVECEMYDLTDEARPAEFAEVYLDEFSVFDRPLLREGAVFYWSIGHETSKTGQVRRYSELRVRRMPPFTLSQRRQIEKEAEILSEIFHSK